MKYLVRIKNSVGVHYLGNSSIYPLDPAFKDAYTYSWVISPEWAVKFDTVQDALDAGATFAKEYQLKRDFWRLEVVDDRILQKKEGEK